MPWRDLAAEQPDAPNRILTAQEPALAEEEMIV
jgi:hypothetical protein